MGLYKSKVGKEMIPKEVGDRGILGACSTTGCPNCNADLGYYGDLIKGFVCPFCGAEFEVEPDITFWYTCIKEGNI